MSNHCCDYRNPCHSRLLEEEKEQVEPAPKKSLRERFGDWFDSLDQTDYWNRVLISFVFLVTVVMSVSLFMGSIILAIWVGKHVYWYLGMLLGLIPCSLLGGIVMDR